jgi:hypothetical protein
VYRNSGTLTYQKPKGFTLPFFMYLLLNLYLVNNIIISQVVFDSEEIEPSNEYTYLGTKIDQTGDNTTEIKHRIHRTRKAINALNSICWHKDITKKQKIIYLSNNNSEHFDVWSGSMANTYQRNKKKFIYRNGCAKEISKKIKERKNKK